MHSVLVEIPSPWGAVPIYSWGAMLGASLVVAWFLIMYLGTRKEELDRELMANAFIITAVAAIVGSRLLFVIVNPEEFHDWQTLFALGSGGLVAYGGFLGGLAGSAVYLRIKRQSLLAWADCVAPALGTGLGLTRIGCYLHGCDFGSRLSADAPGWLSSLGTFPRWPGGDGSPAFVHHLHSEGLSPLALASYPVHPTQLYESVFGFVLFGAAMFLWRIRKFRGQVVLPIAAAYALWRFFIEYLRDDPDRGSAFGFSTSQIVSLVLGPICALLYYMLWHDHRRASIEAPAPAPEDKPKKKGKHKTA